MPPQFAPPIAPPSRTAPIPAPVSPRGYQPAPRTAPIPMPVNARGSLPAPPSRSITSIPTGTSLGSSRGIGRGANVAQHGGGGFNLASILPDIASSIGGIPQGVINAGGHLGQIALNLGKDIIHLPQTTLQSAEQLGPAMWHDLTGGKLGVGSWNTTPVGGGSTAASLVQKGVQQDPFYLAATGHLQQAIQSAENHPLNPILDVAGGYGLAGKAVGAVGRAGLLGDHAAQAMQLSRDPVQLAPGISGTNLMQHYSRNAFTQAGQKAYEGSALQGRIGATADRVQQATGNAMGGNFQLPVSRHINNLRKQAAMFAGTQRSRIAQEATTIKQALQDAKPAGKVERNVAPYIAAFGGHIDTLRSFRDQVAASINGGMPGANAYQHLNNLDAAIAAHEAGKLNWDQIMKGATAYKATQAPIEAGKDLYGLRSNEEMQHALANQSMLEKVPGTKILQTPITHPGDIHELQAAKANAKEIQAKADALQETLIKHATGRPQAGAAEAAHLLPQVKAAAADALQHYHDLKAMPREKLSGLVIHDSNAPMITSGVNKGERLRQVTLAEKQAHLEANPLASYVRMTNPERMRGTSFSELRSGKQAMPAGSSNRTYTGQAAQSGDWLAGWRALPNSQLHDVLNVGYARMAHEFTDRFGLKKIDETTGQPRFLHEGEVAKAKAQYEHQTGIQMEHMPVSPTEHTLVPKTVMQEMENQFKLDNPRFGGKALLGINRGFRNTVLAMSPKLPIMHTVEGVTRTALAGATPMSTRLAYNTVKQMKAAGDEVAANRLTNLTTPGGMSGQMARMSEEDLGRGLDQGRTMANMSKVVGAPFRGWDKVSSKIIGFQRWISHSSETAALGVHMRQQLQEFGTSWGQANTALRDVSGKLAQAYKDPAMAENAAQYVHKVMGQYNNFTARQRWMVSRLMPFAPWYMNAARLVYSVLPRDHPLASAISQDIAAATQNQWNQIHTGLPYGMTSDFPMGPGHWLDVGKFTPAGLTEQPGAQIGGLLFPQFQSTAAALTGHDPFWREFKGPGVKQGSVTPFSLQAVAHALEQAGESFGGPANAIARALQSHGGSLFNTSLPLFGQTDVKPGTEHGAGSPLLRGIEKQFNPFFGVYMGGGSSRSSSGPGSSSLGGGSLGSSHP